MSSELQQILANTVQSALNIMQKSGIENDAEQNEVGNIYDEILNKAPESKTKAENLSAQDEEAFEILTQEKVYASDMEYSNATGGTFFNDWLGSAIDFFDGSSKDGVIDVTKQGDTGDCWLLSGINALSYSEAGREVIKNALEYEEGYTIVHLKGIDDNYSVLVSDDEITQTKGSFQYSSGDDDMIILELAVEKTLNNIANGSLVIDPNSPWYVEKQDSLEATKVGTSSTTGGWPAEAMLLLTGKAQKSIQDKDLMRAALEEFEQNGNKDISLGASISDHGDSKVKIKDANGKTQKLSNHHAYSVKSVKDGVVYVINPWNSGKEIPIKIDDFVSTFTSLDVCDLSDNNKDINVGNRTFKFDDDGNRVYEFSSNENEYTKQVQTYTNGENGGVKIKDTYINENTQDSLVIEYDEEGNKTGSIQTVHYFSEDGEPDGYVEYYKDAKGKLKQEKSYSANGEQQISSKTTNITGHKKRVKNN